MSVTKAVIDMGTNTFHLLIGKVDEHQGVTIIFRETIAVKLGEGGVDKGFITDAAYQRGIEALVLFKIKLDEFEIKSIKAVATAAVRDASNGAQFITEIFELTQIRIEIINGIKEAVYIYEGVKAAVALTDKISLIMDIGGGSTEFILCDAKQIFWKGSYHLGASRLLAQYYEYDSAIETETLVAMNTYFEEQLHELANAVKQFPPEKLIGTAGSFDSFANIIALRTNQVFNPLEIKTYRLEPTELQNLLNEIISSTHAVRVIINGLIALRVDMIVMASVLTRFIIENFELRDALTCTYSLKEGLLLSDD